MDREVSIPQQAGGLLQDDFHLQTEADLSEGQDPGGTGMLQVPVGPSPEILGTSGQTRTTKTMHLMGRSLRILKGRDLSLNLSLTLPSYVTLESSLMLSFLIH